MGLQKKIVEKIKLVANIFTPKGNKKVIKKLITIYRSNEENPPPTRLKKKNKQTSYLRKNNFLLESIYHRWFMEIEFNFFFFLALSLHKTNIFLVFIFILPFRVSVNSFYKFQFHSKTKLRRGIMKILFLSVHRLVEPT